MKIRTGLVAATTVALQVQASGAFTVDRSVIFRNSKNADALLRSDVKSALFLAQQRNLVDDSQGAATAASCWNPKLRRVMGGIAGAGVIETAYLTWNKLSGGTPVLCGADGGCGNVLEGPYSVVPGTDVPLSLLGLAAYAFVGFLAIIPTVNVKMTPKEESENRLSLTAVSTALGVFSVFLMTLLFGVLKESCVFCIASAFFSISLAKLAWLGGAVPEERIKQGIQWSAGTGATAFLASVVLFTTGVPEIPMTESSSSSSFMAFDGSATSTQVLASNTGTGKSPPLILTSSSPRAMEISRDLQSLNARMFGAYWCSHCFDQKERLGKEAMFNIPYIECSKDGLNSQTALCKERDIPGYPTWEIDGKLFPGERDFEELEEIIKSMRR